MWGDLQSAQAGPPMQALVTRQTPIAKLQQLLASAPTDIASQSDPILPPSPTQQIHNFLTANKLIANQTPIFTQEDPQFYAQAFAHNAPFATRGPYQTTLSPPEEIQFRQWVSQNKVPFDPNASTSDYDMRGYWKAAHGQPNWQGGGTHFPDTFKTPYDTTFSGESKYAKPNTPFVWKGPKGKEKLFDMRSGQLIFAPQEEK